MYTGSGSLGFDSIVCTKGEFIWVPTVDPSPNVVLTMAYVNKKTGETFGTCPVGAILLSAESLEALRKFIELAEKDFGVQAFKEGHQEESADTGSTLQPLGG